MAQAANREYNHRVIAWDSIVTSYVHCEMEIVIPRWMPKVTYNEVVDRDNSKIISSLKLSLRMPSHN